MKRLSLILLVLLIVFLPGCGLGCEAGSGTISAETVYSSDILSEDCYLCGGGIKNLIPSYWGQNNVALISLNTFEIKPIEINRYDRLSGRMIEEYAGVISFGGGGSTDGGFSANLMLDYDRGYAKADSVEKTFHGYSPAVIEEYRLLALISKGGHSLKRVQNRMEILAYYVNDFTNKTKPSGIQPI